MIIYLKSIVSLSITGIILVVLGLLFIGYISYQEYEYSLKRVKLENFKTRTELKNFLEKDGTNELIWTEEFTCEKFSETLMNNAKELGYRLDIHIITNQSWLDVNDYVGEGDHAVCKAYIVNEEKWVLVEPQTDEIIDKIIN